MLYTTNKDGDKTSHNFIGIEGNTISTIRYNLSGLEYYVYNKDIRGSTSNIVDNNGNAKISYTYSDFGETKEFGDTTFYNEICYTGGIYDNLSNLYYLNARYYNPEDARFITQDTYRGENDEPNTLHLYVYCVNNPINYIDPSGHRYNPNKALEYAYRYTKIFKYNSKYNYYENHDCANFVSQCLYAGGIPMTNKWKYRYEWTQGNHCYKKLTITKTWTVAKEQYKYFKSKYYSYGEVILKRSVFYKGESKHNARGERNAIKKYNIKKGDLLYFNDGYGKGVRHATIISNVSNNRIQYAAHTNNAYNKTLYDYFVKHKHLKGQVHIIKMKN